MALSSAAGLLAVAGPARASNSSYRLQVVRAEGAGTCPSAAVLEKDVAQRLRRNPFTGAGERGIEVLFERVENQWRAKLYLRIEAAGDDAVRTIQSEAADCSELGKSVTLALALAIAPELPPEPPPEPPKPELVCPPEPPPAPPPPPREPTLHGAASRRFLYSPNLLPHQAPGAALAVSLRGELLGASFGGLFYPERQQRSASADVGFGLSAAFASGCLWARTRDPQVWSCLGLRVGALHSAVYSPEPLRPGDHFFWGAATELGARQRLFGPVFVELGAAAVFPLLRQRFVVASPTATGAAVPTEPGVVYEQGPAAVEGLVGFGIRLD